MNTYIAKAETVINVPVEKVWQALTDPALVKQWLFGTEIEAEWKVGGQIRYRGQYQGKTYEDKGEILEFEPNKKLVCTYWSSMGGLPDLPENYVKVSYELSPAESGTKLSVSQVGNMTEETAKHSEGNWNQVFASMKQVLEK